MTVQNDLDTAEAFGDLSEARSIWGAVSVAQTGNFLEATKVPLAAPKVYAPLSAAPKALTVSSAAKVPAVKVSATKAPAAKVPAVAASSKVAAVPKPVPVLTKPVAAVAASLSAVMNAATKAVGAAGGGYAPNTLPPGVTLSPLELKILQNVPGAKVVQSRDGTYSVQSPLSSGSIAQPAASAKIPAKVPASTAPTLSDAERAANAEAIRQAANRTASINAKPGGYSDQRLEQHDRATALNNLIAQGPAGKAGTDLDQFIMGGKVLAVGASIIASGGVVAGGLGITAGAGSLAAAAGADRLLSAIETGGAIASQANAVLNEAKAAAAKGDQIAQTALKVVKDVAADRIAAAVPQGVKQALSPSAKDALAAVANTPAVVQTMAAAGGGYMTTPLAAPKPIKPVVNQKTAQILGTIQRPRPLWLVSNAGGITSLERTPDAAWTGGFVVFSSGLVLRQTAEAAALAGAAA
jgi:hypothetical protein